jgi:hypothetical protein
MLTCAAASLTSPIARLNRLLLIWKLRTARRTWAPSNASCGTSIAPIESYSVRIAATSDHYQSLLPPLCGVRP